MNLNCNFRKGFHEDIKEVPVAPAHHSELKEQKIPISSLFKDDAPWGPWPLGQCRRVQNSRYTHTLILDWYFVMVEQFTTNLGIRKNKMKKKKRNARDPKWLLFVFQQPPPLIFPWYWQRKLAICIYKKEDKPLNITTKHIYFWFTSLYYTNVIIGETIQLVLSSTWFLVPSGVGWRRLLIGYWQDSSSFDAIGICHVSKCFLGFNVNCQISNLHSSDNLLKNQ